MRDTMRNMLWLGTSLSVACGMSGCVNTPHAPQGAQPAQSALPANEAVIHGLSDLYQTPRYHLQAVLHVDHFSVEPEATHPATAAPANPTLSASPTPTLSASPATTDKAEAIKQVFEFMGALFKRSDITIDATIDLEHHQIELTPGIIYTAPNSGAFIRTPMLFDFAHSQGYIDLSALSHLVVNRANDGKYSQFSFQAVTDQVDLKKVLDWSHAISLDTYRKLDPNAYHDQPLTPADLAAGGARKIALSVPMQDFRASTHQAFNDHRSELLAALKDKTDTSVINPAGSTPAKAGSMPTLTQVIRTVGTTDINTLTTQTASATAIEGTVEIVYLLDASGRVIQNNTHMTLQMRSKALHHVDMELESHTNYSEFGTARVHFEPNRSNTVPLSENIKGSLLESIRNSDAQRKKNLAAAAAASASAAQPAATPALNPYIGTWQLTLANQCTETYYVMKNHTTLVTSGHEVSSSYYTLSAAPDDKGYYKIVDRIMSDNGLKDCSGDITPIGDVSTRYLKFNSDKTASMCMDASQSQCFVLKRVTDAP